MEVFQILKLEFREYKSMKDALHFKMGLRWSNETNQLY